MLTTQRYEVLVLMTCVLRTNSLRKARRTIKKYLDEGTSCDLVDTYENITYVYYPSDL